MSFYDIYDDHKEFQKYGNIGIKSTVLIKVLQKKKRFSIFTHRGINKYEFHIIIRRYDVNVAKKIDQSESVNKAVTKRGLTDIDIDSRIWAPSD